MNEHQQAHFNTIKSLAEEKGGTIVRKEYHNKKHKLGFNCAKDHHWKIQSYSIEQK